MILLIGSFDGNDLSLRQHLYNFCFDLNEKSMIKSCLILYPQQKEKRTWIRPFVQSLRSAGVPRINLIFPTSVFSPEDVADTENMGIYEIILFEDDFLYHFIDSKTIGVRIWLKECASGKNQEKICLWNSFVTNLFSIESSPFLFYDSEKQVQIKNYPDKEPEKRCTLENAVITLSHHTSISPNLFGGSQMKYDPLFPITCNVADLLGQWTTKLPLNVFCGNCSPVSVLDMPEWLVKPDYHLQIDPEMKHYYDYVKGDVTKFNNQKSMIIHNQFIERVKNNAKNYI